MKYTFLIICVLALFSCGKENKPSISEITNEKNYKITLKKENDTIYQISGESNQFLLKGFKDIKHNRKLGWWKVKNKKNGDLYEIEFVFLKDNKENQVKFYKKNQLINRFSQYYDTFYTNNGYQFKFYFPTFADENVRVEFDYVTSDSTNDPLKKTLECKKENDYYVCFIPVKNKNQLIAGIATIFTEKEDKGKIRLSASSMYVNTPQ